MLWDERGAGKTLATTGPGVAPAMTIERMTLDGIEVAEHLRSIFERLAGGVRVNSVGA